MGRNRQVIAGTTLVELMIAVALIGIISLGMVGVFGSISKGIQYSKARTLATNLAQEQMQILKQKSFNKVLVTTATLYLNDFNPDIPYDNGYYPPENILEGSVQFTRYTYVQVADENSGNLTYFGAIADTGMKAITVTVTWYQGSDRKKTQLRNLISNIETTQATSIIQGKVAYATNTAVGIPGALVTIAENMGWADFTNASGNYQVNLNPGSYRMIASARGFFTQYVTASVGSNSSTTSNFNLVAMGSGTIRGSVWINDHPVISTIVGSTVNALGFCSEYVEVFNPSTWTWTVASDATTPVINLMYQRYGEATATAIPMTYNNLTIPPYSYYIFANTTTVTFAGRTVAADAVYTAAGTGYTDLILTSGGSCGAGLPSADSIALAYTSDGSYIDRVGWRVGPNTPALYEGIPMTKAVVMQDGEQFVRRSSTSGTTIGLGRAYDSGSNAFDVVPYTGIAAMFPPLNSASTETVVSGVPAVGAWVTANDGLSQAVNATLSGTIPTFAQFILTSVATGTWNVIVTSGTAEMEYSSVTVTANGVTYIPGPTTSPSWGAIGHNAVVLSTTATTGFISGWVRDTAGNAITNPGTGIPVTAGGLSVNASLVTGNYFHRLPEGTYSVVANDGNVSASYVAQSSAGVVVQLGRITSNVNFTLSQGGRIRGFVTRDGTNALAGVSVIAMDVTDVTRDQEVTGSNGQFWLVNLSTGQYTVEPVLSSGESASPSSATITVTAGSTVHVGTFTVIGSFGSVRGNVTASGSPIRTGVLVICTTATIVGTPPSLSVNTLAGAGYYMTNTYEDGSYSIDVRGSTTTTYKLYAYYTTFNGSVPSTSARTQTNVTVTAGAATTGVNFAW